MYIIRLNAAENKMTLRKVENNFSLEQVGRRGLAGAKGDKGDPGDPASNLVTSVNGEQGVVVLDKSDIGLANVDNTSDASKPVSTATQTALNAKEDAFAKGDLIAGTNVTLDGDLTDRLVGAGDVTVNSSGGGGSPEWGDITGDIEDQTDLQDALDEVRPSRTTFSNADYTVLDTDRYVVQIGTMSADRTVTLPAANSVPHGTNITIADESGTVGKFDAADNMLNIAPNGADTIKNAAFPNTLTSDIITNPYGSRTYVSDGTSSWVTINGGNRIPVIWYSHAKPVAIPSGVPTPLPWNLVYIDNSESNPAYTAGYTIASSMNGLVLPQNNITLNEDITALPTPGFIVITGAPGVGVDTVVYYTGKNTGTKTLTGCNASPWVGISTGTLATNQVVTEAFVGVGLNSPYLWQMTAVITLTAHPNGYRQLDVRNPLPPFGNLVFFTGVDAPALNINNQHIAVTSQPPAQADATAVDYIVVTQNSGTVLQSTVNGLETSILFAFLAGAE